MNTRSGKSGKKGKQPEQERYSSMDISWARDREVLAEQIGELIAWRREEGFPQDTDQEMVVGVLNLVEARRLHNMKVYRKMIREAVARGESGDKAAMDILRAFLRNARNEVERIEGMADDGNGNGDADTST